MNLLVLTNTWPCESQVFVKNLVDGMLDQDYRVTIACKKSDGTRSNKYYGNSGFVVYFSPDNPFLKLLKLCFVLPLFLLVAHRAFFYMCSSLVINRDGSVLLSPLVWYSLRSNNYNTIHCQFGSLANIGLVLKKSGLVSGPVLCSFRGSDISSYLERKPAMYNRLKKEGDLFLPVCNAFGEKLHTLGFPREKIVVYHSAIDLQYFPYSRVTLSGTGDLVLFSAGRLVEKKGFSYAIETLHELVQNDSRYRLIIAGDGPLEAELRVLAKKLGVLDRIEFTGWIDQNTMTSLLRKSHVYIATNIESRDGDIDGIPNIVKEAMATGVPVAAFEHPGLDELVVHGSSGMIVPSKNVILLATAVRELDEPNLRNRICTSARKVIERGYSKEEQAKMLAKLVEDFIRNSDG